MKSILSNKRMALFIAVVVVACNKTEGFSGDLRCEFVKPATKRCSDYPSLQAGRIELDEDGNFEFIGDYEACFDKRQVIAKGQYKLQSFPEGMNLELLADEMSGAGADSGVFPRTIGSLDLELKSLNGVYIDLWEIMSNRANRSKGREPGITIHCRS